MTPVPSITGVILKISEALASNATVTAILIEALKAAVMLRLVNVLNVSTTPKDLVAKIAMMATLVMLKSETVSDASVTTLELIVVKDPAIEYLVNAHASPMSLE